MSEEETKKSISTTQITVPLITICSVFFALAMFTGKTFYEKERAEFEIDVIIPLNNKIEDVLHRVEEFEKQSTRGRFGEMHYELMVDYMKSTGGQYPRYDWLRQEVMKRER